MDTAVALKGLRSGILMWPGYVSILLKTKIHSGIYECISAHDKSKQTLCFSWVEWM